MRKTEGAVKKGREGNKKDRRPEEVKERQKGRTT